MSTTIPKASAYTFDANLEMKDAGLVAASAAAQVDASNKIVDVGDDHFRADLVVDVSAIEIASNDEVYTIKVEGSSSATFASDIEELAAIQLGAQEVVTGGTDVDSTTGRYTIGFTNQRGTRQYRYLRVYTVVAGTIASGGGINYTAFIGKPRLV